MPTAAPTSRRVSNRSNGRNLGGERRSHVESAAVEVEVDERERAPVGKSGRVERQQQLAVLRMRVVVPAEPIVAEGQRHDDGNQRQRAEGEAVKNIA